MLKKPSRKTLENKLDKVFSLVIRLHGRCQRCRKLDDLQCSHIHSRRKMSVRWDLLNAFCLCSGCHKFWWHMHPAEAGKFTIDTLGLNEFNKLHERALFLKKWTIEEMQEHLEYLKGIYESRCNI